MRFEIAETVQRNGAEYRGDLTKQITHLITFRTEGQKYKAAKNWGLQIVSIEWIRDCVERGMILDEKLYDPTLPAEERGRGAWDRSKPKRPSLGKRGREDGNISEGGKRKLRRTASSKLNSQHDGLWGDIVGGNMVAQVERSGVWETNDNVPPEEARSKSMDATGVAKASSLQTALPNAPQKTGLFSGCRFFLYGFDFKQSEILQSHLVPHDAEICNDIEDLLNISDGNPHRLYRLVPHDLSMSQYPKEPERETTIETITTWWVERCLHRKKLEDAANHVAGRPFPVFPIDGFADGRTVISTSGFTGIDLLHFKKAVQLIGATYSEDLTPVSSVLVAKTMSAVRKDKIDHAGEWKIPIVSADWIWDSITAGKRLSKKEYTYRSPKPESLPSTKAAAPHDSSRLGRSQSDIQKPVSEFDKAPKALAKPIQESAIDRTAFDTDEPVTTKKESFTQNMPAPSNASAATTSEILNKSEPLSERSLNSPVRTVSTAPAPSDHPAPRPSDHDTDNDMIASLLAKTKTSSAHAVVAGAPTESRRRTNRILGRATSAGNMSAASSVSRATSVDSTVGHGHPVQYPTGPDKTSNQRMEMLLNNADRRLDVEEDSQPPLTQVGYEDTDALEARELVMARMNGENGDTVKRRSGIREKAVTMGDFSELSGGKRSSRRTAKGGLR